MSKRRNPTSEREIKQKVQQLKEKLEQLQQMKQILLADGIKPDMEDKQKESKLIQQLLGLEKDLKRLSKGPRPEAEPKKIPFQKAKARQQRPSL